MTATQCLDINNQKQFDKTNLQRWFETPLWVSARPWQRRLEFQELTSFFNDQAHEIQKRVQRRIGRLLGQSIPKHSRHGLYQILGIEQLEALMQSSLTSPVTINDIYHVDEDNRLNVNPISLSEPGQGREPVAESEDFPTGTETLVADSGVDGQFVVTMDAILPPKARTVISDNSELSGRLEELSSETAQLGDFSLPKITIASTTLLAAGNSIDDIRKHCFILIAISSLSHWQEFDLLTVLNTNSDDESNSKRRDTNPLVEIVQEG